MTESELVTKSDLRELEYRLSAKFYAALLVHGLAVVLAAANFFGAHPPSQ